jgi:D-alanine transaminase
MRVLVNGRLVPQHEATVSVFDRGFLFGDGVYEVVRYFAGHGVALDLHTARLAESLRMAGIAGFDARELGAIAETVLGANGLADATVYVQVTRGAGTSRAHMPPPGLRPTVVAFATPSAPLAEFTEPECAAAIVRDDPRWRHCAIKTTSLAGHILCLVEAQAAGADECILLRQGLVGEGAYTNVAIARGGRLHTCALDDPATPVLHGTMRAWALDAARAAGIPCREGPVTEADLRAADEVLILSSRRLASAVTRLDGATVGAGAPGPVCRAVFAGMRDRIAAAVHAGASA